MKRNTTERAINHFDRTASQFDTIYTGKKSRFARTLDRLLRWDMVERLERTVAVVKDNPGASVLDIGAGSGRFFLPMLQAGASRIVAVEPAPQMVAIGQRLADEANVAGKVEIILSTFLEAKVAGKCDVSIAIGLYDYIEDPLPYLLKTRDLTLKAAVMTFPLAGGLRPAIRKVRLALRGCPVFFFTQNQITNLLTKAGFSSHTLDRFGQLYFVVARP